MPSDEIKEKPISLADDNIDFELFKKRSMANQKMLMEDYYEANGVEKSIESGKSDHKKGKKAKKIIKKSFACFFNLFLLLLFLGLYGLVGYNFVYHTINPKAD